MLKRKGSKRAKNLDEQGTILVEVLVAALILLLVFTAVIHEITNLSVLRVQLETRDRAVAYASSLHEQIKAAGCGLDVDYVEPSDDGFRGPWRRVQGCALSAQARAFESVEHLAQANRKGVRFWVDGNNFVKVAADPNDVSDDTEIDLAIAAEFCRTYGDQTVGTQICNLGDQTFRYVVPTIGNTSTIEFDVTVNYWFEKIGTTNRKTACTNISNIGKGVNEAFAPDVIARRITLQWQERGSEPQSLSITKRDNVPVDSVEFAMGTRGGYYTPEDSAAILLTRNNDPSDYPFYVRRDKDSSGVGCIWFPFINLRNGNVKFTAETDETVLNFAPSVNLATIANENVSL